MADEYSRADAIHSLPAMEKDGDDFQRSSGEDEKSSSLKLNDIEDARNASSEEPIIRTGEDVSKYAVSTYDTGVTAITFRGLVIGTSMAGLAAALSQIYIFKPVDVGVSGVFLLLFVYGVGKTWEFILPFPKESQHPWIRAFCTLINPGPFGLKEVSFRCQKISFMFSRTYAFI